MSACLAGWLAGWLADSLSVHLHGTAQLLPDSYS